MIAFTDLSAAGANLSDPTSWAPSLSALVAVVALVANVAITATQRNGDNKTAANSVLLSLGADNKSIVMTNGGKSPILDAKVTAEGITLSPKDVTKVNSIALSAGSEWTFLSTGEIGGLYPHQILATFSDVRGRYWKREPNKPAKRTKKSKK